MLRQLQPLDGRNFATVEGVNKDDMLTCLHASCSLRGILRPRKFRSVQPVLVASRQRTSTHLASHDPSTSLSFPFISLSLSVFFFFIYSNTVPHILAFNINPDGVQECAWALDIKVGMDIHNGIHFRVVIGNARAFLLLLLPSPYLHFHPSLLSCMHKLSQVSIMSSRHTQCNLAAQ